MPSHCRVLAAVAVGVCLARNADAVDLPIYDETLQSGFSGAYSYGGGYDFASTALAHGGTHSVAFSGDNYNAVSFTHQSQSFSTATYPTLHFWIRGAAPGAQQLELFVYPDRDNSATDKHAPLDGYIAGGSISSSQWREVSVPLTSGALAVASIERIDLQSEANGAVQPAVYVDDMSLQGVVAVVDPLFADGFEGSNVGPAPNGLVEEHDVTVASMVSDRFTWRDAAGQPRVAVLAHNDQTGPDAGVYANHGGALREYRYQLPGNVTRTATVTNYGNGGYGGFGYVVSHSAWLSDGFCSGDDSPLGYTYAGTWTRVFEGRHHAIFRFQQNYERHCGPNNPAQTTLLPVTIDWVFSTGRDHPLWSVTFDMSGITQNFLNDDSRAPYGELNMDGSGSADISGVAWGDKYKFTTTGAPATLNSPWTWNQPNSVPYVKEWITSTDATMGIVLTRTIDQQDAGAGRNPYYHDLTPRWGTTSANGNAGGSYLMPYQDSWAYQANSFSIGANSGNNNSRLTWGTQYGFLGQTAYASNTDTAAGQNGPFLSGWPRQSYSAYIVLDRHSVDPVGAQVGQVEAVQAASVSASIGSVATSGDAGINRPDAAAYTPIGYDGVYGAWVFTVAGNALDANIAVGATDPLKHPLLILRGYSGSAYPSTVSLGGVALQRDVDYFPSLRPQAGELWITLNRDLAGGTNHLQVAP